MCLKSCSRTMVAAIALAAALLTGVSGAEPSHRPKRPNIVFIMSDDHAVDAVSVYGSHLAEVFQTPNLDRLAAQGARLTHCFATNSICVPSRASILTGQYSSRNGVYTLSDGLRAGTPTVASMLREAGYATAVFGKWHVSHNPGGLGFEQFRVLPGQGAYFDPMFIEPDPDADRAGATRNVQYEGYVTDLITDFTLEWLEDRDRDKPFFLCVQDKAPHHAWKYHPRHAKLLEGVDVPEHPSRSSDRSLRSEGSRIFGSRCSPGHRGIWIAGYGLNIRKELAGKSPEEQAHICYQVYLKRYLRTIAAIDENVGRLLDYLDREGLAENTIVIYTSDQGELLGAHDYWDKRWIWDESIQMPFLIRYPGEIEPGTVNDDMVANVDFAQMLLDFAGVEARDDMQGRSFRANLRGETPDDWRQALYYRYWMHLAHHDVPAHYGIRTRDYKLVFFYGLPLDAKGARPEVTPAGWELYDLRKDPHEMRNVYGNPAYAETVADLKTQLFRLKDEIGDTDEQYPELMKRLQETP